MEKNHSSYDLIQNIDGTFTLKGSKNPLFRGDLKSVFRVMTKIFNISIEQIEIAVEEMDKNDHTRAHFSSFGTFIFSEDASTMSGAA